MRAEILEPTVWQKLSEAIKNPQLITRQIAKLKDKHLDGKSTIRKDLESTDRDLKNTDREESRLLDAYRENVISMDQLKNQMSEVRDKKKRLDEERLALLARLETSRSQIVDMNDVEQVCRRIGEHLDSIRDNFEARQLILTLLVTKIIVHSRMVRIRGVIPTYYPQHEPTTAANIEFPTS
ncbi:MAG: hypothetical protein ABIJ00_04390 [Candidatus Eisenbacteria bacterium]